MLDELRYIHERDRGDALGSAQKQVRQLVYQCSVDHASGASGAQAIVIVGVGNSALAGLLYRSCSEAAVPIEVVANYDIPPYVSSKTLFIAVSYNGNTSETLTALSQAVARGAEIGVVTSGGALAEQAHTNGYTCVLLPQVMQPQYALLYTYKAIDALLVAVGLLSRESIDEQLLLQLTAFLEAEMQTWLPTIPMRSNLAKRTALESIGLSPVIYSGPKLSPAAHAWKRGFNVAAKQVAWVSQYPAAFHEELIGWSEQPVDKPYRIIELRSSFEHEQVQKGFDVAFRLLSGKRPEPIVIEAAGDTLLKQLLWAIVLGDFVTIYTALASGIDPSQERLAYTFNQRMGE